MSKKTMTTDEKTSEKISISTNSTSDIANTSRNSASTTSIIGASAIIVLPKDSYHQNSNNNSTILQTHLENGFNDQHNQLSRSKVKKQDSDENMNEVVRRFSTLPNPFATDIEITSEDTSNTSVGVAITTIAGIAVASASAAPKSKTPQKTPTNGIINSTETFSKSRNNSMRNLSAKILSDVNNFSQSKKIVPDIENNSSTATDTDLNQTNEIMKQNSKIINKNQGDMNEEIPLHDETKSTKFSSKMNSTISSSKSNKSSKMKKNSSISEIITSTTNMITDLIWNNNKNNSKNNLNINLDNSNQEIKNLSQRTSSKKSIRIAAEESQNNEFAIARSSSISSKR